MPRVRCADGVVLRVCSHSRAACAVLFSVCSQQTLFESSPRGHSLTSLQNPNALFSKGPQRHSVPEGGGLLEGTPLRTGASAGLRAQREGAPHAPSACLCCCPTWCSRAPHHFSSSRLLVSGTVSSAGPLPWAPPVLLCPVWSPGLPPVRASPSEQRPSRHLPASAWASYRAFNVLRGRQPHVCVFGNRTGASLVTTLPRGRWCHGLSPQGEGGGAGRGA